MKLKFWIGLAISFLCLYFVFRNLDFIKILEALRSANYVYLAIAVFFNLSTIWLRAERWKYLLAPIKAFHFRHLVPAIMIGFMANNILPARAGEFIRAYLIGKKERISKTAALATIVIERVCDTTTILLFLVIVLVFVKFPQSRNPSEHGLNLSLLSPASMEKIGILSAIFITALLAFLVLLKEFPQKTRNIVRTLLTPFPKSLTGKALELLDSFRLGLQVLKTGKHLVFLVIWSLMVWSAAVIAGWFILTSFGLQLSLISAMFITVLIAFSVALPSSPGYIGPFHAAVWAGVLFFMPPNFDKSTAAGIAIVFHLVTTLPITLMGLFYLWKENMSLTEIRHLEDEEQPEINTEVTHD
jgi:uncharacterized protein (TIRG00374 family)